MRINLFLTGFLILIGTFSSFSQKPEMSDSAKELAEKIETEGGQAILDAGKSGDKSLIPFLKDLDSKSPLPWAKMALAKLGDEAALNDILKEVDDENPYVQDRAMEKLSYIGGKAAVKKFYNLLDDTTPRGMDIAQKEADTFYQRHLNDPEPRECGFCGDAAFLTRSAIAVLYLSKMVEDPPTIRGMWGLKKDIPVWKEWFDKRPDLIN